LNSELEANMPHWFLTNTFYGNWLPGDRRGSVTSVNDLRPWEQPRSTRDEHDIPGTSYEPPIPALEKSAFESLKGKPIRLNLEMAEVLFAQFVETAEYRFRPLVAVAIMANHFHMLVHAPDDPDPKRLLADFKSYGSRALTRRFGAPESETWWTDKGSKRKLDREASVIATTRYIVEQEFPLLVWTAAKGRIV
jgi:REP element-mobilizing transposase RayT